MAGQNIVDEIGTELPDRLAAVAAARAKAVDALRAGFAQGQDRRDWIMVVRDEVGAPLMRMTLREAAGPSLLRVLT